MSRKCITFKCKEENFEAIREKWRKLGYEVFFRELRNDGMLIVGKYKIKENKK